MTVHMRPANPGRGSTVTSSGVAAAIGERATDAELLAVYRLPPPPLRFADHRLQRMLARLDVTTGRQPIGLAVVGEKDPVSSGIGDGEVTHPVWTRLPVWPARVQSLATCRPRHSAGSQWRPRLVRRLVPAIMARTLASAGHVTDQDWPYRLIV